ncbi:hypothetical protein [Lichenicoccus roseus]|uniref:Uncharacterized protein n=1 Tax=Lichenicoccus roseus TaxID=2683649 RepID=A0A5R9J135_9PROT|nr:hypothetical protein [Lichenicoccus roseus]TLU71242.1 hypothetical protein FE263_17200 [Lichenicoccus roseus]
MAKRVTAGTMTRTTGRGQSGRRATPAGKVVRSAVSSSDPAAPVRRKPGRPKGSTNKVAGKTKAVTRATRAASNTAAAKPVRRTVPTPARDVAPKPSKEELRSQVETLTISHDKLRARLREANKAAKAAAARIAELEEQVARHEHDLASAAVPEPAPAKAGRRRTPVRDPGDAVPPGVAVETPVAPDEEAEAARENLEHHLHSGPGEKED